MLTTSSPTPSLHTVSPNLRAHRQSSQLQSRSPRTSSSTYRKPAHLPPSPNITRNRPDPQPPLEASSTSQISSTPAATADAGTQYTPPDWPPTSSRSSLRRPLIDTNRKATETPSAPNEIQTVVTSTVEASDLPAPPPEPRLRQTPRDSFNDAAASNSRAGRTASSTEDESGDVESGSPLKRRKADEVEVTMLPRNYINCNERILALMISDLIMDLIRVNDRIPLEEGQLTRFHSRVPPGISVRAYLERLTFHATLSPPLLLAMVNYIDTLCAKYPAFTVNSLTVHRFLITAACCAAKALSDAFWTNSQYARVGGISLRELAMLEMELLTRMDWEMVPKPAVLEDLYSNLVARSDGYAMENGDA